MLMNPQRLGKGLGGHTRMQWDEILGTSVWEASKKKKKKDISVLTTSPTLSALICCFLALTSGVSTVLKGTLGPKCQRGPHPPRPQG